MFVVVSCNPTFFPHNVILLAINPRNGGRKKKKKKRNAKETKKKKITLVKHHNGKFPPKHKKKPTPSVSPFSSHLSDLQVLSVRAVVTSWRRRRGAKRRR